MNQLYFGDNLDILKDLHRKHPEGYIDLIYIDPPFNSKRNYNVLFEDVNMLDTKAQKEAFADTWSNVSYYDTLEELKELDLDLFKFIEALDGIRISKSAIAYLTTMAIRLYYMHKLLKETGSFYLHCDSTMSHYLKLICDLIYSEKNFQNELIWKRTFAHSDAKRYSKVSDTILYYSKSKNYTYNNIKTDYEKGYVDRYYGNIDKNGRRYALDSLVKPKGSLGYFYNLLGCNPPPNGWRMPEKKANELLEADRIEKPSKGKTPRYKRYLDEMDGLSLTNIWIDLPPINSQAKEALGYPTQKPVALMERIINASSNEGETVADFFCGCGTTIAAAEKLGRNWIGADISHLAIKLISKRLMDTNGPKIRDTFEIHGFPKDIASAKSLATETKSGRFKFEEWIVEVMLHGVLNATKTQTGYDGYFTLNVQGKKDIVLIEVKSGNATLTQLNHFIQTADSKKANAGVFVCFAEQVTRGMHESAKKQGYYRQDIFGTRYDKIQIMTVEDLMDNKLVNLPSFEQTTFKTAKKETKESGNDQRKLFD